MSEYETRQELLGVYETPPGTLWDYYFTTLSYYLIFSEVPISLSIPVSSISGTEKTEVIYGSSNVIRKEIQFFSKAKFKIDSCMDHTRPALALYHAIARSVFLTW